MSAIGWWQLGLAAAIAWAAPSGVIADEPTPVVVEMYTAQGCIACPPADAFFARLADDPAVIALALHVDYWDYLGWTDSFADPTFTRRQKRYARAARARMIYTPQMIIGGRDRVEGNQTAEITTHISTQGAQPPRVRLVVGRQGDRVAIAADADPPLEHGAIVQLVRYQPQATITINRGENAGRQITYRNIVTSWANLGDWAGTAPLRLEAEVDTADPLVVIVQDPGPGPILAAARVD